MAIPATSGIPLSALQDQDAFLRYLRYLQMVQGMPMPQNMWDQMPMMLAAGGASGQTERALRMDPDLGGTGGYPAQAGGTSPLDLIKSLGNDPTRRVTPEEYEAIRKRDKAKQDKAYEEWVRRGKK